jgi:hypothetical protein
MLTPCRDRRHVQPGRAATGLALDALEMIAPAAAIGLANRQQEVSPAGVD